MYDKHSIQHRQEKPRNKKNIKNKNKTKKILTPRNPIFVTFMSLLEFSPPFPFPFAADWHRPTDMQQRNNCFSR
jgi:hypothetical protein